MPLNVHLSENGEGWMEGGRGEWLKKERKGQNHFRSWKLAEDM